MSCTPTHGRRELLLMKLSEYPAAPRFIILKCSVKLGTEVTSRWINVIRRARVAHSLARSGNGFRACHAKLTVPRALPLILRVRRYHSLTNHGLTKFRYSCY